MVVIDRYEWACLEDVPAMMNLRLGESFLDGRMNGLPQLDGKF